MVPTHYDTLQVHPRASEHVIRAAYKALAQRLHPDRNPSPDANRQFQALQSAYEVLSDPQRRASYDRTLAAARAPSPSPAPPRPAPQPQSTKTSSSPPSPPASQPTAHAARTRRPSALRFLALGLAGIAGIGLLWIRLTSSVPSPAPTPTTGSSDVAQANTSALPVQVPAQARMSDPASSTLVNGRSVARGTAPSAGSHEKAPSQEQQRLAWLAQQDIRLASSTPETTERLGLLTLVWQEAQRAALSPDFVLAIVEVVRATSPAPHPLDRLGPMGVDARRVVGLGLAPSDFRTPAAAMRLGCTLLRHDLDLANGDQDRALRAYFGEWSGLGARVIAQLPLVRGSKT